MSISRYQDLYPYLQPDLPGCPPPLLLLHLQQAGRRFCRETEAWQKTLDTIALVADQAEYDLAVDWDAVVKRIVKVEIDDIEQGEDTYELEEESTLAFDPAPTTGDEIVVKVALVPRMSTLDMPEWFMERWGEGIVAGTKKSLMEQRNKPWTSLDRVIFFEAEFDRYVASARHESLLKFKSKQPTVQMRSW